MEGWSRGNDQNLVTVSPKGKKIPPLWVKCLIIFLNFVIPVCVPNASLMIFLWNVDFKYLISTRILVQHLIYKKKKLSQ